MTPGRTASRARSSAVADEALAAPHLVGDLADDERPCHVRPASRLLVAGPEVDHDRQVRRQRAGAGLVAASLPDRGDDHIRRRRRAVRRQASRSAARTASAVSTSPSSTSRSPSRHRLGAAARRRLPSRPRPRPARGGCRRAPAADFTRRRPRSRRGRDAGRRRQPAAGRRPRPACPGRRPPRGCRSPQRRARSAPDSISRWLMPLSSSSWKPRSSKSWSTASGAAAATRARSIPLTTTCSRRSTTPSRNGSTIATGQLVAHRRRALGVP